MDRRTWVLVIDDDTVVPNEHFVLNGCPADEGTAGRFDVFATLRALLNFERSSYPAVGPMKHQDNFTNTDADVLIPLNIRSDPTSYASEPVA